ncbi:NAD-dependent epimerase/dehydratase family protein [Elongatibacter sediminis]
MNVLLTGSSGWLGRSLAPLLRSLGHQVVGVDPVPSPDTEVTGSVADGKLIRQLVFDHGIDAIIHGGALHQPNMATHPVDDFVAVNVQGTLNLLSAATEAGSPVRRFVHTSTTSLMISAELRAGSFDHALWIDEDLQPLQPRNIYGVTKLAAEHLCRMHHEQFGLPLIVLRTARFFPEEDDRLHLMDQSDRNAKTNELLYRRLTVDDASAAHVAALNRAEEVGHGTYIVCAPTPFRREDCDALMRDAPAVVERYFPEYRPIYEKLGWTMFPSIDRVYDAGRIERELGFRCRTDFGAELAQLANII